MMVQAAGRWQLPGLPSSAEDGHAAVPVHLVVVEDSCASPAAGSRAAASGAASSGGPPTVLGVGSLLLSRPDATGSAIFSISSGQLPGDWRSPAGTQRRPMAERRPLQQEPLRCCRLVSPATGTEVGSICLAARLVHTTPDAPAVASPQQPAQAVPAVPPAAPQPEEAGQASRRSPRQEPQRRKMRSAGVQASPATAPWQPACQPPVQQHAAGPAPPTPLLLWPPSVCTAGAAVPGAWCAVQGMPAVVPVLGVPLQPQLPPALLAPFATTAWGLPAAAPHLPLHPSVAGIQLPSSTAVPLEACPAALAPDPLAPRVAAIRTRLEQQAVQQQQQQGVEHAAGGQPGAVAEGTELLCTLRSPLKGASRAPPLQHHLREVSSPRRWDGKTGCEPLAAC